MVKRVLKCCGLFAAIALVLLISVLPASRASALGMGYLLPAPNPDIMAAIDLRMDCVFTDSSGDYYWIYDYPLGTRISSSYGDGYFINYVYHDDFGDDVFCVTSSYEDGFLHFYFENLNSIVIRSLTLRSGSAFPVNTLMRVGVMDFVNPESWSLQLVGYYPVLRDNEYGVSLDFHSFTVSRQFSYAGGPEAYLNLDTLIQYDDPLVSDMSISCTKSNDMGFHVFIPASDKSVSYKFSDYLDKLEFSTDKTIIENVVVSDFPTNWTDWLGNAVSGFFELQITPTLSLGKLLATVVGILVFALFVKLFK